jgi:hypothetical protein
MGELHNQTPAAGQYSKFYQQARHETTKAKGANYNNYNFQNEDELYYSQR